MRVSGSSTLSSLYCCLRAETLGSYSGSGVAEWPRLARMAACATVAAPLMPLVRAVPWAKCGPMAGVPVEESSLSDSSESSIPSRCPTAERRCRPEPDRLKRLLSSRDNAALGITDDTIMVRMVRWRSFRSGRAGPPRRLTERFCRRCSRDIETSVRSSSASFNS